MLLDATTPEARRRQEDGRLTVQPHNRSAGRPPGEMWGLVASTRGCTRWRQPPPGAVSAGQARDDHRPSLSGIYDHPDKTDSMRNRESCNAIDIAIPTGTVVIAVVDGIIGSHYAHLPKLGVRAGDSVSQGDVLGLSGLATGVRHLHLGQEHGDPGALIGDPSSGYVDKNYPG
jgi:murein DD-endopeptidase MepM/ murein hydrolase activator NlpD